MKEKGEKTTGWDPVVKDLEWREDAHVSSNESSHYCSSDWPPTLPPKAEDSQAFRERSFIIQMDNNYVWYQARRNLLYPANLAFLTDVDEDLQKALMVLI